jgi:glucose-6-phosphate-specific signal transduction histidine kinase
MPPSRGIHPWPWWAIGRCCAITWSPTGHIRLRLPSNARPSRRSPIFKSRNCGLWGDLGSGLTEIDSTSVLAEATATGEESRGYFREISQRARELITSMDEIVWAVNPRNDNLVSVTTYFCHYAEYFLRATPLGCRFNIPETVPALPLNAEQRHSLFLAYKEALHNAVKHSRGTSVTTQFALEPNSLLRITVADERVPGLITSRSPA